MPPQGVPTGPRGVTWQEKKDATLLWTEALDNGEFVLPTKPGWGVEVNEAGVRKHPPGEKGHIAVRARNRWGQVVYRTLAEVVLTGESTCCPHVPFRIEQPSFVVIVPQGARSVSLEGWRPESTARFVFRGDRID